MKKALMVILAMVMALTMVMGSVSTAAARAVDNGYNQFTAAFTTTNGNWNINSIDYFNSLTADSTEIYLNSGWFTPYTDEVASSINFNNGTAKFKNAEVDITIKFSKDPSYPYNSGTHKEGNLCIQYSGTGTLNGTYTYESIVYTLTNVSFNGTVTIQHDIVQ